MAHRAQLLPALGTGVGIGRQLCVADRAGAAQIHPAGGADLGLGRHAGLTTWANQVKDQPTRRALGGIGWQMHAAIGADVLHFVLRPCRLIARPADRPTAGTGCRLRPQVLLTGRAGDMATDRAGAETERESFTADGAGSQDQRRRAFGVANDGGVDRVVAGQFPPLLAMWADGCAVPDLRPAGGAGLYEKRVTIGADLGPGGQFKGAGWTEEDELESAFGTGPVLVGQTRPAAGTHDLAAL